MKQRDDIIVATLELQDDPWIHKRITFKESGDLIADIMEGLGPFNLETQTTYAIRLSVDEAISNAWRHGSHEADDIQFDVSYLISDEGFQLRVKDSGPGFDHESLPDPTVEENLFKSHGRGVFLIRQMMNDVEFNETGNEITIFKKFPPRESSTTPSARRCWTRFRYCEKAARNRWQGRRRQAFLRRPQQNPPTQIPLFN